MYPNPSKESEVKKMRIRLYGVFNKKTNERVYTNCDKAQCEKFIAKLDDKENYEVRNKYHSF